MPIIVDPAFTPPPPPETVTSSDGVLSATLDAEHAGVLLVADFSALDPVPHAVRFQRADGALVRSGNDALAPGGVAVAYDREAPLGGPVSWTATAIYADGTVGDTSTAAALTVPAPATSTAWLKVVSDPDCSVVGRLALAAESGRVLRTSLTATVGSPYAAGTWDVPLAWAGTVTFRTDTEDEYLALVAALSAGTVLMQQHANNGLPAEMYLLPQGSLAAARLSGAETGFGWQYRAWSVDLVQVDRPATIDSTLYIPGLSYDTVAADFASYDTLAATVPTYAALLGSA